MDTTASKEDYLKAIAEAEADGDSVIAATLVRWLGVTPAAVTMALRRLRRDGLAAVRKDGRIQLTAKGRSIAERIRFRHHLIERMLAEIFGMEWYKIHDEAERLEHSVSTDFEQKLIERLGANGVCPHGNNIRGDGPSERRSRGLTLFCELKPGTKARVQSVFERDRVLLEYFDGRGLRPGVEIRFVRHNPDDTIEFTSGTQSYLIGSSAAAKIWVQPLKS